MNKKITLLSIIFLQLPIINIARETPAIFQEVKEGNVEAIKKRIENCEDLSQKDESGNTVLHVAAQEGHEEIVEALTDEPDYSGFFGWVSWLASPFVSSPTLPNKDEANNDGDTPLHKAFAYGRNGVAEKLLIKKVKVDIKNKKKRTPVFMVVYNNKPETIPVLVKYNLLEQTKGGQTLLHKAVKHDKPEMVKTLTTIDFLIKKQDGNGLTAPILAAQLNKLSLLDIFKKQNVNLSAPGGNGIRPIHAAISKGNYECVKFLLENSDSLEIKDNQGNTPAHYAAHYNKKEIIDLLLAYKADIRQSNNDGYDPFAIATEQKHYDLMKYLAKKPNVAIDSVDKEGRTAFLRAAEMGDYKTMQELRALGVMIKHTDHRGENAAHKTARNGNTQILDFLLKIDKNLALQTNGKGDSPLFVAAQTGNIAAANILFKSNPAMLKAVNIAGETIIHHLAKTPHIPLFKDILSQVHISIINTADGQGYTPLHTAIVYNNVVAIKELEKYGARYTECPKTGNNPAFFAAGVHSLDSLRYILQHYPQYGNYRNRDNETLFMFVAKKGDVKTAEFLLHDTIFTSGQMKESLRLAYHYNPTVYQFLKKKEDDRRAFCKDVVRDYSKIHELIQGNKDKLALLYDKDRAVYNRYALYNAQHIPYYSEEQLYHMQDREITNIKQGYRNHLKELKQRNNRLNDEIMAIEATRVWQAALEAQQKIAAENERRLQQEQQELEALQAQRKREQELQQQALEAQRAKNAAEEEKKKALNEQQRLLDQAKKEQQDKEEAIAAIERQKERDRLAAAKALVDQQKHNQALEGQVPYNPMDLKPSAPPMDDNDNGLVNNDDQKQEKKCVVCNQKALAKAIPCKKCKKTMPDVCPQCFKKYSAVCPDCIGKDGLRIPKEQGECCIGAACCTEEQGVTIIPCKGCKKYTSSDRICKACLQGCINESNKKGKPHRCPHCGDDNGLDDTLLDKVNQAYK